MITHPIYVSHSWLHSDATERLINMLDAYKLKTPEFSYQFYSVSKDDPAHNLPSNKRLAAAIEEKMKSTTCLIILAGIYDEYGRWISLEMDIARKLKKKIIVVEAVGKKHTSPKEKRNARFICKWDAMEIGEAVEK